MRSSPRVLVGWPFHLGFGLDGRLLRTGTAWGGLCLIQHHHRKPGKKSASGGLRQVARPPAAQKGLIWRRHSKTRRPAVVKNIASAMRRTGANEKGQMQESKEEGHDEEPCPMQDERRENGEANDLQSCR